MKKLFLPLIILFVIALLLAKYAFDLDIEGLFEGALEFIGEILDGPS